MARGWGERVASAAGRDLDTCEDGEGEDELQISHDDEDRPFYPLCAPSFRWMAVPRFGFPLVEDQRSTALAGTALRR
jgi:hypothetical protein